MNGLLGNMFLNCPLCSFNQFGWKQPRFSMFILSLNACSSGMNRLVISSSGCQNMDFFIAVKGWHAIFWFLDKYLFHTFHSSFCLPLFLLQNMLSYKSCCITLCDYEWVCVTQQTLNCVNDGVFDMIILGSFLSLLMLPRKPYVAHTFWIQSLKGAYSTQKEGVYSGGCWAMQKDPLQSSK